MLEIIAGLGSKTNCGLETTSMAPALFHPLQGQAGFAPGEAGLHVQATAIKEF